MILTIFMSLRHPNDVPDNMFSGCLLMEHPAQITTFLADCIKAKQFLNELFWLAESLCDPLLWLRESHQQCKLIGWERVTINQN